MLIALMYHYIHSANDDAIFHNLQGVSVEEFEKQLQFMIKNFTPINHKTLLDFFTKNQPLPKNAFYLTFDDGFKQHFTNVLPLLKKYNLQGSFFVPTMPLVEKRMHFLEKQRVCQYAFFDTYGDFLKLFYEAAKEIVARDKLVNIEPTEKNIQAAKSFLSQYDFYSTQERFYRKVRDFILTFEEAETIIDKIFHTVHSEEEFIDKYYMTLAELKSLNEAGMSIGAHSHSHPHLETLERDVMQQEIDKGFAYLRENIDKSINSFSYPFGTYSDTVIDYLTSLNIDYCFTTKDSIEDALDRRYEMKRVDAASFKKIFFHD
jgi:peptidoglycan/xylan/chitin deacetylase (PgdA/CDA1 family)